MAPFSFDSRRLLIFMSKTNIATYQATPEKHSRGTYFFTDCGHRMYSVKDDMAYHNCYCPGCLSNGIHTVLYIRGSEESNKYWDEKIKNGELPKILGVRRKK